MTPKLIVGNVSTRLVGDFDRSIVDAIDNKLSFWIDGAFFSEKFQQIWCPVCKRKTVPLAGNPYNEKMTVVGFNTSGKISKRTRRCSQHGVVDAIKLWDGKKHLFSMAKRTFPTGLVSYCRDVLRQNGIDFVVEDQRINPILADTGGSIHGIQLRDYQQTIVEMALKKQRGIVQAPTGSGKTEIFAEIIARLNVPTTVYVTRTTIFHQTKDRLEERLQQKVGLIGDGYLDIKRVNVAMVQTTFMSEDKRVLPLMKNTQCMIIDECFRWDTKVLLPGGRTQYISDIVEKGETKEVVSWNEEKKVFENKRILRRIKKKIEGRWWKLILENENGVRNVLYCTPNHKFWTENGYKKAEELGKKDVLKCSTMETKHEYICAICGWKTIDKNTIGSHNFWVHGDTIEKQLFIQNMCSKRDTQSYREQLSNRMMGGKNPMTKLQNREKMKVSWKRAWEKVSLEEKKRRIKIFIEAPRFRYCKEPTLVERRVMGWNFSGLTYTGKGGNIVHFLNGRKKIPDFTFEGEKKVVEVGDMTYWHSKEEVESLIKQYEKVGYRCLFLSEKEVFQNEEETKKKVERFLYNHKVRVVFSGRSLCRDKYCYNLEIEDNHNYFTNSVLVSNCHHCPAESVYRVHRMSENAFWRFGFSATPWRDDGADIMIEAATASKFVKLPAKELIEQGYLSQPYIHFIKCHCLDATDGKLSYPKIYQKGIVENEYRNSLAAYIANYLVTRLDKTVLIAVTRIEHGHRILEMLQKKYSNLRSCFVQGENTAEEKKQVLRDLEEKKLDVVIATTVFGEGIDVKTLGALINCKAADSSVDTFQLVGRVMRATHDKKKCIVVDFMDEGKYLEDHSKHRLKMLKSEESYRVRMLSGFDDIQDIKEDW